MATKVFQTLLLVVVSVCIARSFAQSKVTLNHASTAQNITLLVDYSAPRAYYRVYIDTQKGTGYSINDITAQYLLENSHLYSYAGNGNTVNWKFVTKVATAVTGTTHQWTFAKSIIGINSSCSEKSLRLIGQVGEGPSVLSTNVVVQTLAQDAQCNSASARRAARQTTTRKLAVPTYFNPYGYGYQWDALQGMGSVIGMTIMNPDSGPGPAYDSGYATVANNMRSVGSKVLGYVPTSNGQRDLAACTQDIDAYYSWYTIDGIFFDESWVGDCNLLPYYTSLYQYAKSKGASTVVINPGSTIPECYMSATDIVLNAETDYADYVNWKGQGWEVNYDSSRFWHIVHSASADVISNIGTLTRNNNAGWVYMTSEVMPNPYMLLPSSAYLSNEASVIQST